MVKNWLVSLTEKLMFISPDSERLGISDPTGRTYINMTGWGIPDPIISETRSPTAHGADPLTIKYPPRTIRLTLVHAADCRDAYWEARSRLVDFIRLNRTNLDLPNPGSLRWYRSDMSQRQIDVMLQRGPAFTPANTGWREFTILDELIFVAHDPIIYDPRQKTVTFSSFDIGTPTELVFPITFGGSDITFGGGYTAIEDSQVVNYIGNWVSPPTITITGPADDVLIENDTTGHILSLNNYQIAAGDSVVFDLNNRVRTVTLTSTGASLLANLSQDSDLSLFGFYPAPDASNGANTIKVTVANGSGATEVKFEYFDKYLGI